MSIPIVFSFNDGYTIPAGVCITSLLSMAKEGVFYNILILYGEDRLSLSNQTKIKEVEREFGNCSISFYCVNDSFKEAYEIRNVSIDTYFRLLIPMLFPNYPKVIYSDVDIIFNRDISDLFKTDMSGYGLAGVKEYPASIIHPKVKKHIEKLGLIANEYINAGLLIFNNDEINSNKDYEKLINDLVKKKFTYQDQDILNIIFKGKIKFLSGSYNYNLIGIMQEKNIKEPHVLHYTMQKPWSQPKLFGERWWAFYKKSIFYDEQYYFSFLKQNYKHFDILMSLGKKLEKIGFYKLYLFLQRFSKS